MAKFKVGDKFKPKKTGEALGEILLVQDTPSNGSLYLVKWSHWLALVWYNSEYADDAWELQFSSPIPLEGNSLNYYEIYSAECQHTPKTYIGSADAYDYCTKCNKRLS